VICRHPTTVFRRRNLVTGSDDVDPLPCWSNSQLGGPSGTNADYWKPIPPAGFA
jgi:hypothetical protein